jgi:hypothetical protein
MWTQDEPRKQKLRQTARSAYIQIAMDHLNGDFMEGVQRLGGQTRGSMGPWVAHLPTTVQWFQISGILTKF